MIPIAALQPQASNKPLVMAGKTSDRLLGLLALFATDHEPWTVEAAAAQLGMSVSHTYRYFRSLAAADFIAPIAHGRYVLGPAISQLDRQMRLHDPLIAAAAPLMRELVRQAPHASVAMLCRFYRDQVMCVYEELVSRPRLEVSYERGLPMPIWRGAASKAILAHLGLRQVKPLQQRFAAEFGRYGLGGDWEETKLRLRALRGMPALHTERELGTPTAGIAAPLFADKTLLGSLGLVCPIAKATAPTVRRLLEQVAEAAGKINLRMRS